MKLKERTTAALLIAIFAMAMIMPVVAQPQSISVTITQKQFQWRAMLGPLSGGWTSVHAPYTFTDTLIRTGKVLHGAITYSPPVMAVTGTSNVYLQNKIGDWVLREGAITYTYAPLYLSYTAVNYFRGYMQLDSSGPFVRGVLYQWIYVYQPYTPTGLPGIPDAFWCPVMNAWLVGFSIYLQGTSIGQSPSLLPIPPPVPANIYNPLGL